MNLKEYEVVAEENQVSLQPRFETTVIPKVLRQ